MAQHDYDLVDAPPLTVRTELNAILSAVLSSNSGPLAPLELYPGMHWFKSDTGVLSVLMADGTTWAGVPVDGKYLPITGGTVAALTVSGAFSNPDYDKAKGSYIGSTAPANPLAGMLWYDTSVTPNVLRIRNKTNSAWLLAVDIATPIFAEAVNITATGANNAQVAFVSQGETRYIINEYGADRFNFYADGTAAMVLTDSGDVGLKAQGYAGLTGLINAKQNALGFTPIRQADGVVTHVGGVPARVYRNGVDQGVIQYGAPAPVILGTGVAIVGALIHAYAVSGTIGAGATVPATALRNDHGAGGSVGTYYNLGGSTTTVSIFQRIA